MPEEGYHVRARGDAVVAAVVRVEGLAVLVVVRVPDRVRPAAQPLAMAHERPIVMSVVDVRPAFALEYPRHEVVHRRPPRLADVDEVHRARARRVAIEMQNRR